MKNFLKTSILAAGLFLLPAHAADIRVLVYGEHSGTDIVYHYTLVNNGSGKPTNFAIGVKDAGDGGKTDSPAPGVYNGTMANSYGTLTRWPTGTTFVPVPNDGSLPSFYEVAVPDPGSITTPTQPPGWVLNPLGFKQSRSVGIGWTAPEMSYRSAADLPCPPTGADAGQTLSGFSVRVPATGPGRNESYVIGDFVAEVWYGVNWFKRKEQQIFAAMEKQDTLPPTLSVTLTPSTMLAGSKLLSVTATIAVTDNYDPAPEIKLESIVANRTLRSGDILDATFGTNDRAFKLKPVSGTVYTVTYSATDGTGNKATASATVTVKK